MQWIAFYNDGSNLMQYEGTIENKYIDIDRNRLIAFGLFEGTSSILMIKIDPSKKLIYRRRTLIQMKGEEVVNRVVYLVGYQVSGNEPVICYYYPETQAIELDGARDNLELLPHEIEEDSLKLLPSEGGSN